MTTTHTIKVDRAGLIKSLEMTATPLTIILGAPHRGKRTLLRSLYFTVAVHKRHYPNYILSALFPGLRDIKPIIQVDDYFVEVKEDGTLNIVGEPPWKYPIYITREHSLVIRMILEAAQLIKDFKHQHDTTTMLAGLVSILTTIVERYGRYTYLSRLALWACDVFTQADLEDVCSSWKRTLNNVFFGLGAKALASIANLTQDDMTLSDREVYKKFVETLLIRAKNNTIMLIEDINRYVNLRELQDLVRIRSNRGDNVTTIVSITLPMGAAKKIENGEIPRSEIISRFQEVFDVDLDPLVTSLYLFKRWRGKDKIVAERLFP